MRRLRNSLILLLFLIGIFLNLERIDLGNRIDLINIQGFVYLLAAGAVFSTFILSEYLRPPTYVVILGWIIVYFILKVTIFNSRVLFGGIFTYLTITEMAMVTLLVFASYRVANNIHEFEDTVATVTLGDVSERVKRIELAGEDISKELARSRRYDSPLSVMVLKIRPEDVKFNVQRSAEEVLQGMLKRYTANKLIRMLDRDLRRTDMVIDQSKDNNVVILLPETSKDGTEILVDRIREVAQKQLGISISCGYATFPRDALTFEELLHQAENQSDKLRLETLSDGAGSKNQ